MHSNPFTYMNSGDKRFYRSREQLESFHYHSDYPNSERITTDSSKQRPALVRHSMPKGVPIEPHAHDVLMGRGGRNNQHSGNDILRQYARVQKEKYKISSKKEKSALSRLLVKQMHELDPPARFLKRVQTAAVWEEVSDDTAREKASQVLRDAVAGLLEKGRETPVQEESIPLPAVSASASSEHDFRDVARATPRSRTRPEYYPSIGAGSSSSAYSHHPSSSYHPPTPSSESSKRRRYSQDDSRPHSFDDNTHISSQYPVSGVASSSSLVPGYSPIIRRHSDHMYPDHAAHSDPTGRRSFVYQQHQYHQPYHPQPRHPHPQLEQQQQPSGQIDPRRSRASMPQESRSRVSQSHHAHRQQPAPPPSENLDEFELFQGELLDSDVE